MPVVVTGRESMNVAVLLLSTHHGKSLFVSFGEEKFRFAGVIYSTYSTTIVFCRWKYVHGQMIVGGSG